ncbi:MAG: hypothetical protein ACKOSS_04765 [Planctomycetia bacterium]
MTTSRRPALVLLPLLAALLGLLPGCQASKGDPTGMESEAFPAPDMGMVYEAAQEAMRQQGFTADSSESSEAQGLVVSRYRLTMAPFSGQGHRDKATVRIKAAPSRPAYWIAEVNVLRQPNTNITEPSNPIAASWGDAVRVNELENVIRARIEMAFAGQGVSDAFRRERGMLPRPEGGLHLGTGGAPGWKP